MAFAPPARHLLRARDLADARYAEPLRVEDLAYAAGLSRAHFSREFRRAFGEPPHTYLLTRRLDRAWGPRLRRPAGPPRPAGFAAFGTPRAALLRFTDRSVAEICLDVGLRSAGSFTTSFTRTYGRSPTAYRAAFPPAAHHALVPACVIRAHGRPRHGTSGEDSARPALASPATAAQPIREDLMFRVSTVEVRVQDQDEALAFYTQKLGMEVRADATLPEMGGFRWLTVGPPAQPDLSIVLMPIPDPPILDAGTGRQLRELMAKGVSGGTIFLTTDDCRASYEELRARGVEFTEAPEERPYGVDAAFRDPSGNAFRLTQIREMAPA